LRGEDRGELAGGVAGEVDDGREAGRQRRAGPQQVTERAGLAGQDDGQFLVAAEFPRLGQLLVHAAQHVPAAVGQGLPGVRVGDYQQVTAGPDGLHDQGPGLLEGGARQVRGGDLDQLPVPQQPQVAIQAGDHPGDTGLTGAATAGKHQVLPRRPADLEPARRRACSARSTVISPASCSLTASRPGRPASSPVSCRAWGCRLTLSSSRSAFPADL
jgi:hypothetical protein